MRLFILLGQRHCKYEGEYAPEALAIIDQIGMDNAPEYMAGEHKKHEDSKEFSSLAVIKIKIPWDDVDEALFPVEKTIIGRVINEKA